jgi:hypothetical protein
MGRHCWLTGTRTLGFGVDGGREIREGGERACEGIN